MRRRTFLEMAAAAAAHSAVAKPVSKTGAVDPIMLVNPFIGTGGHGHTYPGATVPFGAVQLSPDTYNSGWDWCSGYYTTDTSLMGFSHTHLSGTGANDLLDFLVVPRLGEVKLVPGTRENPELGYRSRFSHMDEAAMPGRYQVRLENGIKCELTATERVGVHRYTFPNGEPPHILLDLVHTIDSTDDLTRDQRVKSAAVRVDGNTRVLGMHEVAGWAPLRPIYFALESSRPFRKAQLYSMREPVEGNEVKGRYLHAALHFDAGAPVVLRVGISMISSEAALANIRAEQKDFDFDRTARAAAAAWRKELARIQVDGGTRDQQMIFTTALYHMMCAPTLLDDADGRYRGMDGQVHTNLPGEHNYSTFSLWDTFRALHPSYTLWQQERVAPLVNCLIRMAEQSPAGMPIWPLMSGETFCMTGYHSASVIAEACAKKVEGIDWQRAYKVMRKRNMDDDYEGLAAYRQYGYIPAGDGGESVSKALEYCYNDWACRVVAEATGNAADAKIQLQRAGNYRNLFDPKTQFIRPRMQDGSWAPNFDPRATGHVKGQRDYTDSNAWQTTFAIMHDTKGYAELFGGREAFLKRLDQLFTAPEGVSNEDVPDMTGWVGQYVHGNEPSHHIAFLYTCAGQPWKTQKLVREILTTQYRNGLDGLSGNEDCGQMSAWYVMAAMGLYAVDPVSATYVLTSPLFDRVAVRLAGGKELLIEVDRPSPDAVYIAEVKLNGRPLDRLWVRHAEIGYGARLHFTLAAQPNLTLGVHEASLPPSRTV